MSIRSSVDKYLSRYERQFVPYNNITVSRSAILHNFDFFQKISPGKLVIPVLKSNAYGHGIQEVATILKAREFPYIAVDGYFEALRVREISKQPVLIMGAINPANFARMKFKNFAFVVHDEATIKALGATGKRLKIHLEVDTGMHRHGIDASDLEKYLRLLKQFPHLELEGVMSHLADADNSTDDEYTCRQTKEFDEVVQRILAAGSSLDYVHIAQSAGSAKALSKYANTLRVGLAMYGVSPLTQNDKSYAKLATLRPALTLTSTIAKVLKIKAGDSVSYSRTFKAKRAMYIGVLPLGYYEGIPRSLSNTGSVRYEDKDLPIVGRVCMNHMMIDLSNASSAMVGDKVTIIEAKVDSKNSVQSLCQKHELFSYELLVWLNENIHRTITE